MNIKEDLETVKETPAFPGCVHSNPGEWTIIPGQGLTKREWFAGMAMQGLISSSGVDLKTNYITAWAFEQADSMIEASKR